MPNIMMVLKSEIARIARKEMKSTVKKLQADSRQLRRQISALRREMKTLASNLSSTARVSRKVAAAVKPEESGTEKRLRFSGASLKKLRTKLGLTQGEFASLAGVTSQSVYQWERKGTALRLRDATRVQLAKLRGMGKREVRKLINPES